MNMPNGPGSLPSAHDSPGGVDLGRVWTSVAAEVWRRHPGRVERLAARLLRSPGLARALVTTPSLLLPWLISTAVVFGTGGLVSLADGWPVTWLLAPGVAAIAVAYAYGPGVDPAWELAYSMPVSHRMVLLVRAVAVFAVNAFLGIAVSLATYSAAAVSVAPRAGAAAAEAIAITVGWLLPMAAICALTLAVAVAARSAAAGAAAGVAAWAVTVLAAGAATGQYSAAVTDNASYFPYLAVAACAALAVGYATRSQRRTP